MKIISSAFLAVAFLALGINSVYAQSVNDTHMPIYDGVSSYVDTNFAPDTGADSFLAYDKDLAYWRIMQMNPDWYYLDGNAFQFNYNNSILNGLFDAKANVTHSHVMSDISGLSSILSEKVDVGYMGSLLGGLQVQIDSKATSSIMGSLSSTVSSLSTTVSGLSSTVAGLTGLPAVTSYLQSQINAISTTTIQIDWNEASTTAKDFIKNKPTLFDGTWASLTGKPTVKRQETYSGTTTGSGTYTVTFGTAFSVAPNVQANLINGSDTQSSRTTSISTTGFTVLIRNRTDVLGLLPSYANVTGATVDVLVTEK